MIICQSCIILTRAAILTLSPIAKPRFTFPQKRLMKRISSNSVTVRFGKVTAMYSWVNSADMA